MKENTILEKSFAFSVKSIKPYKLLIAEREFDLARQFFKSATSIGANAHEADAGYSLKDFAAKMSIASKEARETLYWIRLIEASGFVDYEFDSTKKDCEELIRLLTSIVKTAQRRIRSAE